MSLPELQRDPKRACERNVYMTQPRSKEFLGAEGGPCDIGCQRLTDGIYQLEAFQSRQANPHYFYPWRLTGVGKVTVPKTVPDGTIVMTGGLNGCTLVVSDIGNAYVFYHDGDSKYLKPGDIAGTEVARVTPRDYDPLEWGYKAFRRELDAAGEISGKMHYGHCVLAVKKNGRFGLYVTGSMQVNGKLTSLPLNVSQCLVTF